jgi:hypothetical protein
MSPIRNAGEKSFGAAAIGNDFLAQAERPRLKLRPVSVAGEVVVFL